MDFLKNLFGGDGKADYAERIPDTLSQGNFSVNSTFLHGFLSQPSCMAYDSVQQLLSIGSHRGNIVIIGKSGLERHFSQPNNVPVLQLLFVENRGHLISRCNDSTIYLWDIASKKPIIKHKLEFQRGVPSLVSYSYQSDWFYVGMEGGNVHIVQKDQFEISGYDISWNKVISEGAQRNRPGDVIGMQEHPLDPSKMLLAFSGGLCVLWNLKIKSVEKRFKLSKNSLAILMSIAWHASGKQFAGAYSDGSIAIYNIKNEGKPERVFYPHGSVPGNSPINQLQWIYTEPEPVFVFSGGFPDSDGIGVKSLTLYNSKNTNLLSLDDSIIQFLCLPLTPFVADTQKLFAVAVLTEKELVVHDLQTHGFPVFNIPYSFDISSSQVCAVSYCGNCPDDFVAELQSVLTKLPQKLKSTKRWPLTGGKWGQESPDPWTDLIITGHVDGSVRVWYCRSVVMQPLLTINTSSYLKQAQKGTPLNKPSRAKFAEEQETTPTNKPKSFPKMRKYGSDTNLPVNRSKSSPKGSKSSLNDEGVGLTITQPNGDTKGSPKLKRHDHDENLVTTPTTTPRAGGSPSSSKSNLQEENAELTILATPTGNHSPVLGKGKADNTPVSSATTTDISPSTKRKPTIKKKVLGSIGKKLRHKSSKTIIAEEALGETDETQTLEEVPAKEKETDVLPPLPVRSSNQDKPERPIQLLPSNKQGSTDQTTTPKDPPSPQLTIPSTPSSTKDFPSSGPGQATCRDYTPPEGIPEDGYIVLSLSRDSTHPSDSNFNGSSVHLIHMEPHSQTMCVATYGGHVLCMDFSLRPVDRPPQSLQINYCEDSVIKPDESDNVVVGGVSLNYQFDYTFTNELDQQLPGFHVLQHCFCYYGRVGGVLVTGLRYNQQMKILVIGSDCGLSVVNTGSNQCLKTLGHMLSILYLCDPSSYSRQCRKLVEERFHSDRPSEAGDQSDRKKGKDASTHLLTPLLFAASENVLTSKEIIDHEQNAGEQLITCIEIVKMFFNKTGEPSLTLWVGTKGGRVCVYIIKTNQHSRQRKIELLPTAIILEMKCFVVGMMFLSEWGERLINPYKANSNDSQTVLFRRSVSSKNVTETEKPVNYAVITLRDKIRCMGFPVNQVISKAEPNLSNGFIVDSDFFACDGLPCIASWTNSGLILVFSLPGLKPMLQINYTPFLCYRSLYSFKVSCDGQAVHQTTPTQIQRLSLIKANHLNLPHCLPDVFMRREDPQPLGRGILQNLFKQSNSVDRDELFSVEVAGKAWRSVAKKDESLDHGRQKTQRGEGRAGGGGASGATNAFRETRLKLDQRGKDLSKIEEQTEQLQKDSADFADVAQQLAEKYKRKRWL